MKAEVGVSRERPLRRGRGRPLVGDPAAGRGHCPVFRNLNGGEPGWTVNGTAKVVDEQSNTELQQTSEQAGGITGRGVVRP